MTIARPAGSTFLVHHHPGPIAPGAPLVVEANEQSVLVRAGAPIRVIGPGRYELPAELAGPDVTAYFVLTTPVAIKFGGRVSAPRGPSAVFGEATVQVHDPVAASTQLAGVATGEAIARWLGMQLQRASGSAAARHGADVAALHQAIPEHADLGRYGLAIVDLRVTAR